MTARARWPRGVLPATGRGPIPGEMIARILRLLILLALTLMPLRMVGLAPATAADHAPQPMAHCADMPAPVEHGAPPQIDCMIACATLPAVSLEFEPAVLPAAPAQPSPIAFVAGIAPGADPPPPRVP